MWMFRPRRKGKSTTPQKVMRLMKQWRKCRKRKRENKHSTKPTQNPSSVSASYDLKRSFYHNQVKIRQLVISPEQGSYLNKGPGDWISGSEKAFDMTHLERRYCRAADLFWLGSKHSLQTESPERVMRCNCISIRLSVIRSDLLRIVMFWEFWCWCFVHYQFGQPYNSFRWTVLGYPQVSEIQKRKKMEEERTTNQETHSVVRMMKKRTRRKKRKRGQQYSWNALFLSWWYKLTRKRAESFQRHLANRRGVQQTWNGQEKQDLQPDYVRRLPKTILRKLPINQTRKRMWMAWDIQDMTTRWRRSSVRRLWWQQEADHIVWSWCTIRKHGEKEWNQEDEKEAGGERTKRTR